MTRDKTEKLGTLFLAVFSTGLAAQLAAAGGLEPTQWLGAAAATLGSVGIAVAVRVWRQPEPARAARRN
jgi:hypothetical protein